MTDSNIFYDRKFRLLLEDSIFLLQEAIKAEEENRNAGMSAAEWRFTRSSIYSSALLLESAANCCISTLELSKKYFKEIDKLPVISKFEYFLIHKHIENTLDRGCLATQQASELISIRNLIVHPKPYKTEWTEGDGNTKLVDLGKTTKLKLPKSFFILKNSHGLVALKAAMLFLNYFFKELCEYTDRQVREMLINEQEYPLPQNVSYAHNPEWIRLHDEWGIEVDFLIDVEFVKEREKEFREHLENMEQNTP